ncbi:hypothetical protein [Flavobacterium undicola]|nr:hypothetical protein [Flavobacterium undicola]MBA0884172.1 hypothetical protein [Flavobacterium undicola]
MTHFVATEFIPLEEKRNICSNGIHSVGKYEIVIKNARVRDRSGILL